MNIHQIQFLQCFEQSTKYPCTCSSCLYIQCIGYPWNSKTCLSIISTCTSHCCCVAISTCSLWPQHEWKPQVGFPPRPWFGPLANHTYMYVKTFAPPPHSLHRPYLRPCPPPSAPLSKTLRPLPPLLLQTPERSPAQVHVHVLLWQQVTQLMWSSWRWAGAWKTQYCGLTVPS